MLRRAGVVPQSGESRFLPGSLALAGVGMTGRAFILWRQSLASNNKVRSVRRRLGSPSPSEAGKLVKFTSTLSSNGGVPKGQQVTFSYNGSQIGAANVTAEGRATFSTKTLPVGTDTVQASYAGSADYSSASGSVEQTVN